MTTATAATTPETGNQLAELFQYTVDAYKTFAKLAENLPNPISAETFAKFAENERAHRDLLEIRYLDPATTRMKISLGGDLGFQDILEGDLSYRETAEMLISRERTIERKLVDASKTGGNMQNLFRYVAAGKRANLALLERELELIRLFPDWWKREDAQSIVIHGMPE